VPRRSSFLHNHAAVRSDRRRGGRGLEALIALTTFTVCAALQQGLVASAFAAPASACPPPTSCARLITLKPQAAKRIIDEGKPLLKSCAFIDGNLDLRGRHDVGVGPIVLRNSCVTGAIRADSTTFRSIIDLSGTTVVGPANFYSAEFDRAAEFDTTNFEGPATFAAAAFHGAAGFFQAAFAKRLIATDASFDRGADFSNADFQGVTSFLGANFAQQSRFTDASFGSPASFYDARFGGGSDFSNVTFHSRANFDLSTAQGDLGFQEAHFIGSDMNAASFRLVLFAGTADFSNAGRIHGSPLFEDAVISSLDLDGAEPTYFGKPRRIDKLRISSSALPKISWPLADRVSNYRLLEKAARNADDLAAANEAKVLRRSLERESKGFIMRQFDWVVEWGIGGYLVRPYHPAVALLIVFLLGILVRSVVNRRGRRGFSAVLRGIVTDAGSAFHSFRRIKFDGSINRSQLEPLLYTVLILVLLANLEAISPPVRNFLEGLT
jgi:uncharacterized protein YjbI with pentapeptide repeats